MMKEVVMRYVKWFPGVLILFIFITTALTQENVILLNSDELGEHQRPLVTFSHKNHEDRMDCIRCHHDYDEFGTNQGGEGQRCAGCHQKEADENPIPLMRAFHLLCKECHQKISPREKYNPPIMCGQCHKRKSDR